MTINSDFFTRIKKFYKTNFYMCSALIFGIWVAFFDSNSLVSQQKTKKNIRNLKYEKNIYIQQINEIKIQLDKIQNDEEQMKRLAREKYFLRNEGEEIYLLKRH